MRRPSRTVLTLAIAGALPLAACGSVEQAGPGTGTDTATTAATDVDEGAYVNVVKLTGIAWFDRMNEGVQAFAKDSGLPASQTGPATNSPEQQVSTIQSLIAQKPKAMAIVPSDPSSVTAVIKQARAAGITVVTHEAPTLTDVDADIEAFGDAEYGEAIMSDMASCMKGQGEYVQFVGTLTAETHMAWSDAAYKLQQKEHPAMTRVSEPVESNNNGDTAYTKAKELLQAHPDLVGFQGASSEDVPGIARAIREAGLQDDTCVFGTGVPSQASDFMGDGSIDSIYLWDPKLVGDAMLRAAQLISDGTPLKEGTDLGVEGYNSLRVSKDNPSVFLGDAMLVLTPDTVGDYDF